MRIGGNSSPWFRNALSDDEREAVRAADPADAVVTGLASSAKGPFSATLTRGGRAIGSGSGRTPADAIAKAVEHSLESAA